MDYENLVSIVIPVYNRVNLVSKAIESSINQTYTNIEIIIGDNCSTDGTWELLQEYAKKDDRINIFRNEENIGPVKNWIECVKRANGEYVKILFSDDWMDLDWIEKSLLIFKINPQVGFVYSIVKVVNGSNNKIIAYSKTFNYSKIFRANYFLKLSYNDSILPVSPGCFIFRKKDVLENLKLSLPNSSYNYNINGAGSDMVLILLTVNKYRKVAYFKDSFCYFLKHEDSFSYSSSSIFPIYNEVRNILLPSNICFYKKINIQLFIFIYRLLFKLKFI